MYNVITLIQVGEMIMKRLLAALLLLGICVSMMAGCAQTPTPTEPTQGTTETPTDPENTGTGNTETGNTEPDATAAELIISEVMPNNRTLVLGHEKDWVEIYNREDVPVDLNGYFLTDDSGKPKALPLSGQIAAGGYLVVELDDDGPFKLSKEGETVYLTFQGETISQLTYTLAENGESFDAAGICAYPTPGFANTQEGYQNYISALQLPELIISEVMSSNNKYLPIKGECYDWVEIYNNSGAKLSLKGYYLTDKRNTEEAYYFPDVSLEPGEYAIVYCSGLTSLGKDHAPFKISASGETIYLGKDGQWVDALVIPEQLQKNESFGRSEKLPSYQKTPTPGKANDQGFLTTIFAPASSAQSGVYEQPITVTLTGEGTIYYTLDGSCPSAASSVYSQPLNITGVTTVRTFCISEGRTSPEASYTYVVGAKHDLPVVHVAISEDKLTGTYGILNHIDKTYEYEAMLTLIENGEEKFSVPFGFRLHGNDSRKGDKQNFQLRFRGEYGAEKLEYPLFDNRDFAEYNSLLLKGGSEDFNRAMVRDELMTAVVSGTTALYTQACKPVVLYLNGQYWGIYYLRERFEDDYVANNLGVSEESVDLLEYGSAGAASGSNKDYLALRQFVGKNDMTLLENYEYVAERIDVLSLMDWYICRSYFGDIDLDNIRRFRSSETDGKWRWMFFDLDWGMYRETGHCTSVILENKGGDKVLIQALLKSEVGRDTFLKRFDYLMDTVLNEKYINGKLDEMLALIESEIPRDRERWGCSLSYWQKQIQQVRNCADDSIRRVAILADLKKYFSLTDAQMESYFGS